jgi:hypothetical protein
MKKLMESFANEILARPTYSETYFNFRLNTKHVSVPGAAEQFEGGKKNESFCLDVNDMREDDSMDSISVESESIGPGLRDSKEMSKKAKKSSVKKSTVKKT